MGAVLPFLLAMVAAVVLLEMWADKLRIAYPILLVVAGLAVSFVPGLPAVRIHPDLIFFIFLPPLLFEAAWGISFKEMRKWWRIIGSFAFLVVFFTALSVAIVTNHFLPGFTIALGFLLGGIVAPPDAVSTGAITKFVKVPKSTSAILQGESLLNDASALIIFRFALVAVGTGQFIWHQAALTFGWMVIGGAGIGLALAWFFVQAHKRLPTDASSDIALLIIEPYFMYWVAEQLHCSGVLAVVTGGLFMSARRLTFLNSASRIQGANVWESFVFILNGVVFLIIGLELPEIVSGLRTEGIPISTAIGYGVLVTAVLIVSRILSAYTALVATYIFRPGVVPRIGSRRTWLVPMVLGWSGMRGVVSLAAALAIPVKLADGAAFPQRELILFITFVAILLTLVIQGLTLPVLIRYTHVFDSLNAQDNDGAARHRMKTELRQHIYQFLRSKHDENKSANIAYYVKLWEERAESKGPAIMDDEAKGIFIELLESQRKYLTKLNTEPDFNEEIIRSQLYQIDLEEERVKAM